MSYHWQAYSLSWACPPTRRSADKCWVTLYASRAPTRSAFEPADRSVCFASICSSSRPRKDADPQAQRGSSLSVATGLHSTWGSEIDRNVGTGGIVEHLLKARQQLGAVEAWRAQLLCPLTSNAEHSCEEKEYVRGELSIARWPARVTPCLANCSRQAAAGGTGWRGRQQFRKIAAGSAPRTQNGQGRQSPRAAEKAAPSPE